MENFEKTLIKLNSTIKQALKHMDSMGEKTLFVVNSKKGLLGAVTDGDIRRWILSGESLTCNIANVMNSKPVVLKEGFTKEEAKELMLTKYVECLPVINRKGKIIYAMSWMDLFETGSKAVKHFNLPVVIMSGGAGTRLAPFTNILPKSLMPIGDKPIIEVIIEKFREFGCRNFYLSVNYKANILRAYFKGMKHDYKLSFVQEEMPLGTIGSLHLMKDTLKSDFFVNNCDVLIDADYNDIWESHKKNKNDLTMVVSLKHYVIPYGICEIENGGILKGLNEKPEYDLLANTGLYLISNDLLKIVPANKPYDITDFVKDCSRKGKKIGVYPVSDKSWIDVGQWREFHNSMEKFGKTGAV